MVPVIKKYKKTIYTVLESDGILFNVLLVTTSKKKLWFELTRISDNFITGRRFGYRTDKIGSYSTFTKKLTSKLILKTHRRSTDQLIIQTWEV